MIEKEMKPHIYTIIVTYNAMRWLEKTCEALTKSTTPTTIIVVDNQSQDSTPQFIRQHFPQVILIQLPRNLGFGKANNIGITEALTRNADYVFLLNQDAYVHPDTIGKLVHLHSLHPQFGVLSPIHLDGTGKNLDFAFKSYINPPNGNDLLVPMALEDHDVTDLYPLDFVNAAAWMVSKECLERVGGFDPLFFMYGEDNDYLYRVQQKGLKIAVVPGTYINHDRQQITDKKKYTFKKSLNWHWSRSLIELKNTSNSGFGFIKPVIKEFFNLKKQVLKSIIKLDMKNTAVFITLLVRLTLSLPAISRNRKISTHQPRAFL